MRREEVAGTLEKGAGMERGCGDSVGREGRAVNVCLEGYREMWKRRCSKGVYVCVHSVLFGTHNWYVLYHTHYMCRC